MLTTSGQIMNIIAKDGIPIGFDLNDCGDFFFSLRTVVTSNYMAGLNSLKIGVAYYYSFI